MVLIFIVFFFFWKICRTGQYIISGSADGVVSIWDSTLPPVSYDTTKEATQEPVMKFVAHGDLVNGARYKNPFVWKLITSLTVQKHYQHCSEWTQSDLAFVKEKWSGHDTEEKFQYVNEWISMW